MKRIKLFLFCLLLSFSYQAYADKKNEIPNEQKWERTDDRDNSSPWLYQDESSVYVYSEKQLDNVVIGITDMQGNTYHYEVTTISASTYYAISIKSLPAGTYYLCVYQGSNYVIGYLTI